MSFTVEDFRDLTKILDERPEWRAELRRLILTEELLDLPRVVQALAEAHQRAEQRLTRIEEQIAALAEAQRRTEEALVEFREQIEHRLDKIEGDTGELKGFMLEVKYRSRPFVYFKDIARRARTIPDPEVADLLETARADGTFTQRQFDDVAASDIIIDARDPETGEPVRLVVEVSWGVGAGDVKRAAERAQLLEKLGTPTIPVVAGKWLTPDVREIALPLGVWRVTDGSARAPTEG